MELTVGTVDGEFHQPRGISRGVSTRGFRQASTTLAAYQAGVWVRLLAHMGSVFDFRQLQCQSRWPLYRRAAIAFPLFRCLLIHG